MNAHSCAQALCACAHIGATTLRAALSVRSGGIEKHAGQLPPCPPPSPQKKQNVGRNFDRVNFHNLRRRKPDRNPQACGSGRFVLQRPRVQ